MNSDAVRRRSVSHPALAATRGLSTGKRKGSTTATCVRRSVGVKVGKYVPPQDSCSPTIRGLSDFNARKHFSTNNWASSNSPTSSSWPRFVSSRGPKSTCHNHQGRQSPRPTRLCPYTEGIPSSSSRNPNSSHTSHHRSHVGPFQRRLCNHTGPARLRI